MKRIILIYFVLSSHISNGQTSAQLDINKINATVNTIYHPLFHQISGSFPAINYQAGFEAPKGSGRSTIFASTLWIGGMDLNDSLHMAVSSWGPDHDFISGPIMDSIHYSSQISQWNRVWSIKRSDVLDFINFFNGQSQQGYQIPSDFITWPAHGNTSLGQAQNLAPFYDNNIDGVYDVLDGDYPQVPGDQCIYYIFNDDTTHSESGGEKMGIEVHAFVYSFNCPADSALMNTVFVKYKIINRSPNTYFESAIGIFTDTDLGGSNDDYIACNVSNGSYYIYNGDAIDEDYNGVKGYHDSLAAQSVTFLAGPVMDDDGFDNPITQNVTNAIDSSGIPYSALGINFGDGTIDNERLGMSGAGTFNQSTPGPMSFPSASTGFYNFMNGKWNDGSSFYYGGCGYQSCPGAIANGLIETNFIYPDDSDPLFWATGGVNANPADWNEVNSGNVPGDRSSYGWSGPFTFESGSVEEIDLAYVFARDCQTLNDPQASVAIMETRIDDIRDYFIAQQTPCSTFYTYVGTDETEPVILFQLYPNPSSSQFTLSYSGEEKNISYSVLDILGKEITSGKIISEITSIDCSKWSRGVYLVKIGSENGYRVKKVVVE